MPFVSLASMRFDLVVLDLKLPRLSGMALLDAAPTLPPVVSVSGRELDDADRHRIGGSS